MQMNLHESLLLSPAPGPRPLRGKRWCWPGPPGRSPAVAGAGPEDRRKQPMEGSLHVDPSSERSLLRQWDSQLAMSIWFVAFVSHHQSIVRHHSSPLIPTQQGQLRSDQLCPRRILQNRDLCVPAVAGAGLAHRQLEKITMSRWTTDAAAERISERFRPNGRTSHTIVTALVTGSSDWSGVGVTIRTFTWPWGMYIHELSSRSGRGPGCASSCCGSRCRFTENNRALGAATRHHSRLSPSSSAARCCRSLGSSEPTIFAASALVLISLAVRMEALVKVAITLQRGVLLAKVALVSTPVALFANKFPRADRYGWSWKACFTVLSQSGIWPCSGNFSMVDRRAASAPENAAWVLWLGRDLDGEEAAVFTLIGLSAFMVCGVSRPSAWNQNS